MSTDHYQALGVLPDASAADIRAAYLRLMREHHPDRRPGDAAAEDAARRINAAWEVLGHSARRASYDRLRTVRSGGAEQTPGATLHRDPHAAVTRMTAKSSPAYSADHHGFREDFQRACLRVGVTTVLLGMLLLLAIAR
jgi:curved DNA-binding protein CbpA